MLDSALLQTNFVGRDGFVWWIGMVAPPEHWRDESTDIREGWSFRCKVRIIGYHPFEEAVLPSSDLPWAHVLVDASKGAGQGCLGESSSMVGGETVFGFFMDGEEAQQPVIFGALPRSINSKGPENVTLDTDAESGAFGVQSGKIFPNQATNQESIKEQTAGTPSDNADNKHGEIESEGEGKEGGLTEDAATIAFSNTQLGPHSMSDGCKDDALGEIANAIGSFLTTVNSLTEFAEVYIDAAQNLIGDIKQMVNKVSKIISGAMKAIINKIRKKVMKLLSKVFKKLQALIIPEPQKPFVSKALEKIIDIIFCFFNTSWEDLLGTIKDMLLGMVGKAINPTVCAIEQMVGNLLASIHDGIKKALKPVLDGLDWLTGALGSVAGLLGKVSSYVDMLLSFLDCTNLTCKEYEDWTQGMGLNLKPAVKMKTVLEDTEIFQKIDELSDDAGFSGDVASGLGVYDARAKFSLLSMLGGGLPEFFDCNNRTQNPQTQDDLGPGVPPGFIWSECIPPQVQVYGDGTKTAILLPIVSSIDGSILTLEILEPGRNYTAPPFITIVDKTRNGGGAKAEAILDENGSIVDIFMLQTGSGYCTSTNVIPPKYPVTESPDEEAPFITFTTPADNAVGVETSVSLSITFNEPIVKGEGEVVITESTSNVVHERINVKDNRITFLSDRIIQVDPKSNLRSNTEYHISMSEGSFKDLADNAFAGMARTDTYNFTTRGVSGIGSEAVGIVTSLIPYRPGIGYTSGDRGVVGTCEFDLVLTPAGSIVGINNINCQDKHKIVPPVTILTKTGRGAGLIPIMSYSPDFVADSGAAPTTDGGFGGGVTVPDGARAGGNLYVKVVDCVYSIGKTQVGWVNGNPYYGDFHVHPSTGVKMVGPTHTNIPHATIYNTREESLGQPAPVTYTQSTTTTPSTQQTNVSDTTTTSQSTTSDTTSTQQVEPQQTTQQPTQQSNPTPPTDNTGNTGSSGPSGGGGSSGGGGYGGGY